MKLVEQRTGAPQGKRGAARDITRPMPGYWAVRLTRGGPLVPAAIVWERSTYEPDNPTNLLDRSAILTGYIGGKMVSPSEVWERKGKPITKAEYEFELKDAAWAKDFAPQEPKAQPERYVDLREIAPIGPP